VEAKKQFTVWGLPQVLVVQLKRFDFLSMFGSKISDHVDFEDHAHIAIGNPDSDVDPSANLNLDLNPGRNPA